MILYVLKRLNGEFITKLNKKLRYCDFLHFKETSASITGAKNVHLQYGPVPDVYDFIFGIMEHERLLDKKEIVFDTKEDAADEEFTELIEPERSVFSEKELQVMDFIVDTFRNYTATSIKDKSHQETAYIKTGDGESHTNTPKNFHSGNVPNLL